VYGYIIRVIQARYDGDPEPPGFDDWGGLLSDGIQAVIIGFVYLLIPIIVGAVSIGGAILGILTGTTEGAAIGFASMAGGFLLSFLLSLVFGYAGVAAILNFAYEGDLGAGFDFGTIKELILSGDYAIAWLAAVVVFIIVSIITGFLNAVPFLGMIVSAFLFFYAQIVAAFLWAEGFTETIGDVEGTTA
jgi:hypothetical protein